jgi:uncharacterized membrane protein
MQMLLRLLKLLALVWLGVLVTGIAVILALYGWAWAVRAIRSRRARRR